jgi:hypothetical protein
MDFMQQQAQMMQLELMQKAELMFMTELLNK